jgi:hypothetical protein
MNFKPDPSWGITGTHDCSSLNASFLCCGAAKDVLTAKSLEIIGAWHYGRGHQTRN